MCVCVCVCVCVMLLGFSKNPLLDPKNPRWLTSAILKIDMKSLFLPGWSDLDKISQTGAEWHVDCGDVVEIETSRIPIWRTFGRIQWHVIQEPPATLQGVRIPSAILKIVFRHILYFFLFSMQFRLWRAAAFVSSPIHLFVEHSWLTCSVTEL